MIPYTSFLYFGVSLYALLPTLLMRLFNRFWRALVVLSTAGMILVQYWSPQTIFGKVQVQGFWLVLAFVIYQWLLAAGFLAFRKRAKNAPVFYAAVFLGLLPLLGIKFIPLADPAYLLAFLGISYVTFRSLDVIFGIQDELISALPPVEYMTYVAFFPTISSGPIDRFNRFHQDWQRQRTREEFMADLDCAVHNIFTGFLYKYLLAVLIKTYWMDPVAHGAQLGHIASYMYAYSLYLFFDFAGYSAFAVGFSYLIGIHTPDNFNRPFLSRNIRDFWNRWHMSLSFWFRDHIYSRFVFAAIQHKWFKSRYTASFLGYFLTMGLMGVWHGTQPHYLIYGAYHGILLAVYDVWNRWNKRTKLWTANTFLKQAAEVFVTVNIVCFGLLIFSGRLFQ